MRLRLEAQGYGRSSDIDGSPTKGLLRLFWSGEKNG